MKNEIKKRLDDAVEQFNQVNEQLVQLSNIREQLRGRVQTYQELLNAPDSDEDVQVVDAEVADEPKDA